MASEFIAIDIRGLSALSVMLRDLPPIVRKSVIGAVSLYLRDVFKIYPPYTYVSRKAAYGQQFKNPEQRAAVMAKIREGEITPGRKNRSQNLADGWKLIGSGEDVMLVNETPYAALVMGEGEQARMMKMIGWQTDQQIITARDAEIQRKADAAADKALHQLERIGT